MYDSASLSTHARTIKGILTSLHNLPNRNAITIVLGPYDTACMCGELGRIWHCPPLSVVCLLTNCAFPVETSHQLTGMSAGVTSHTAHVRRMHVSIGGIIWQTTGCPFLFFWQLSEQRTLSTLVTLLHEWIEKFCLEIVREVELRSQLINLAALGNTRVIKLPA